MPEIPGSLTVIPAPIEKVLMTIAVNLLPFVIVGGLIFLAMYMYTKRLQKRTDIINTRMRNGIPE